MEVVYNVKYKFKNNENKTNEELKELCKNNKIKYIPMQEVLEKVDFIDGLHPNHNGHKKIFEYIIGEIR